MDDFLQELKKETAQKIRRIEAAEKDKLKRSFSIALVLAEANSRLKNFIVGYRFPDQAQEIHFFKEVKPRLVSELIYHCQVYNMELNRPVGGADVQRAYLNRELKNIEDYIERRSEFYSYYRLGLTHDDACFFTRDKRMMDRLYLEPCMSEREPGYSTNCDYKLAKVMANERLELLLRSQLEELDLPRKAQKRLAWAAKKTFLIELLYSLDSYRAFGKTPLREVVDVTEEVLGINLGNVSSSFADMRERNDPTPFLDALREALLKRMDREVYKKKK